MYLKIPTLLLCKYVSNYHIFNLNCAYKDLNCKMTQSLPQFYRDLIRVFFENKEIRNDVTDKDIIWNNSNIQYKEKNSIISGP